MLAKKKYYFRENLMHKVVFVDDDPMILKGIQRIFKRESSIAVYTENNAIDGLRLVKKISPEVVVSDMLMPEIKGDEFLEQVRNYDMQIIRVILSGYSQREDTLRVLINGTCQWFFSKPSILPAINSR